MTIIIGLIQVNLSFDNYSDQSYTSEECKNELKYNFNTEVKSIPSVITQFKNIYNRDNNFKNFTNNNSKKNRYKEKINILENSDIKMKEKNNNDFYN